MTGKVKAVVTWFVRLVEHGHRFQVEGAHSSHERLLHGLLVAISLLV